MEQDNIGGACTKLGEVIHKEGGNVDLFLGCTLFGSCY